VKKNITKAPSDISRRLKDTAFALRIYSIWAMSIFLVFGLFGIYPQTKMLIESVRTHREMQSINKVLADKINFVNQEALSITQNTSGIAALDKALPKDYEVQNYVVDFSFAVSRTGYGLTGMNVGEPSDGGRSIAVNATLEGNGSLGGLVKSIESLSRAAQVNGISFSQRNEVKKEVTCLLNIYVLK